MALTRYDRTAERRQEKWLDSNDRAGADLELLQRKGYMFLRKTRFEISAGDLMVEFDLHTSSHATQNLLGLLPRLSLVLRNMGRWSEDLGTNLKQV